MKDRRYFYIVELFNTGSGVWVPQPEACTSMVDAKCSLSYFRNYDRYSKEESRIIKYVPVN